MCGPLVSVIIPAYNRHELVQRAIDSVSAQTYDNVELVLVDDGSEPPLQTQVSFPNELDTVETVRHATNQGGNAARISGIEASSGEYVAFLDSDDEWRPKKLELQIEQLQRTGATFSSTGVQQVDGDGRINAIREAPDAEQIKSGLLRKNLIGTFSSVVVAQELLSSVGLPDPELPAWQDWEWYLRVSEEADFTTLQKPLVVRHNEGGQISSSFEPKRNVSFPVVREQITNRAASTMETRAGLAGLRFQLGYSALVNGYYAQARRSFMRAIVYNPFVRKYYVYLLCSGPQYEYARSLKRALFRLIN
ncbi:glycosyltransferase [Halobacteria archaeon AArc-dxtr1]|nr:glycosyltransferase [Halobacteria archaeon AArc-dxtr1]